MSAACTVISTSTLFSTRERESSLAYYCSILFLLLLHWTHSLWKPRTWTNEKSAHLMTQHVISVFWWDYWQPWTRSWPASLLPLFCSSTIYFFRDPCHAMKIWKHQVSQLNFSSHTKEIKPTWLFLSRNYLEEGMESWWEGISQEFRSGSCRPENSQCRVGSCHLLS